MRKGLRTAKSIGHGWTQINTDLNCVKRTALEPPMDPDGTVNRKCSRKGAKNRQLHWDRRWRRMDAEREYWIKLKSVVLSEAKDLPSIHYNH